MHVRHAIPLVIALLAILVTVLPSAANGDTIANARSATAIYNDPTAALAGGYELLTDAAGLACIAQPGAGAMGVHPLVRCGDVERAEQTGAAGAEVDAPTAMEGM